MSVHCVDVYLGYLDFFFFLFIFIFGWCYFCKFTINFKMVPSLTSRVNGGGGCRRRRVTDRRTLLTLLVK